MGNRFIRGIMVLSKNGLCKTTPLVQIVGKVGSREKCRGQVQCNDSRWLVLRTIQW